MIYLQTLQYNLSTRTRGHRLSTRPLASLIKSLLNVNLKTNTVMLATKDTGSSQNDRFNALY